MIPLLFSSAFALLFVTALGIGGLANFWVQQRHRQFGIRRALGATSADIIRYFQIENFLIVGIGVLIGMMIAIPLNIWMVEHYELHRLPLLYLPAGAILMLLLGQIAILGPALRAARIPPLAAIRS